MLKSMGQQPLFKVNLVTHLFSFLSINSDSESLALQMGRVIGIRRLREVSFVCNAPWTDKTHAPPPCRVDVPTLKTITWQPSDLSFISANNPDSCLEICKRVNQPSPKADDGKTHERIHVG